MYGSTNIKFTEGKLFGVGSVQITSFSNKSVVFKVGILYGAP